MTVNYNRTRATVKRLIDAYGREVTMVNDQGPAVVSAPLGAAAPRVEVPKIKAVFVRPSGYIKLGESFQMDPGMWPEADKIFLVLPSLEHDFQTFTRVLDEGKGYKIYKTEMIKPGMIPLLLYVGLRQ